MTVPTPPITDSLTQARVTPFFDPHSNTLSYVLQDPESQACAVVDSVLDLDYASGSIEFSSAQRIIDFIRVQKLELQWILETHVHADHLSAATYLKKHLGGQIAIGTGISTVQDTFGEVFAAGPEFKRDGSQFDLLLRDGDELKLGQLPIKALHTPGHTPACMSFLAGDALFVGDTLFMPDGGTARADFPGGDAAILYRSIQRLLSLPPETRMFVCHDYLPEGRELEYETTVGAQREGNIHVHAGIGEAAFVRMREERDRGLGMPKLILPSLQVNMRAGHFPPPTDDGRVFLQIPVGAFGGADPKELES